MCKLHFMRLYYCIYIRKINKNMKILFEDLSFLTIIKMSEKLNVFNYRKLNIIS